MCGRLLDVTAVLAAGAFAQAGAPSPLFVEPVSVVEPKLLLERWRTPRPLAPGNRQKMRLENLKPGATCHVLVTVCDSAGQESPAAVCSAVVADSLRRGEPAIALEMTRAGITALSWDTEGTGQEALNLLRARTSAGPMFEVERNGTWEDGSLYVVSANAADGSLDLGSAGKGGLRLTVQARGAGMRKPGSCEFSV